MGPYVMGSFCAGLSCDGSFCDGSFSDGTLCRGTGFPVAHICISVDGRLSSLVDPEWFRSDPDPTSFFKPGQLNYWQITGRLQDFKSIFEDFLVLRRLGSFERKFGKLYGTDFLP